MGPEELAGALRRFVTRLEDQRALLDSLNVFPVADSDTGTNLLATARAVADALPPATAPLGEVTRAVSRAALSGARGNSGVILSQWLAGFGAAAGGPLDGQGLAAALAAAAEAADRAVAEPVEGTMLTVARDAARAALGGADGSALDVGVSAHRAAVASVGRTPSLLPVLAEAGVVDAGALGFTGLLASIVEALGGRIEEAPSAAPSPTRGAPAGAPAPGGAARAVAGYEITFLQQVDEAGAGELRRFLETLGDSVVVAWDGGTARAHLHCRHAGAAVQQLIHRGGFEDLRIEALPAP